MGNRLSKIYTKTGDKGTTGLGDGSRVDKDCLRVETYGTSDELNSIIGMVLAHDIPDDIKECFTQIQHHLFDLGGELCVPGATYIDESYVIWLENTLDKYNDDLPKLKDFILPAGGHATSVCHLARTVCRRTERLVTALARDEKLNPLALSYVNRLSDLLFVIARVLSRHENGSEVLWDSKYSRSNKSS